MNLELQNRIVEGIRARRANFDGSDAKFSLSLGISGSQYSRVMKGDTDKVLSDANWISIARKLEIALNDLPEWNVARTPVYEYITAQLEMCRLSGISLMMCDMADIGKTFTAKHYCRTHKNAVYVDCSQVKTKFKLIKHIAKEFGVGHTGTYSDVYGDLVFYLKSLPLPVVVLDEAGDLEHNAFLELKALWNATEHCCGWYMMGANGLAKRVRNAIEYQKVGYEEIFSRYGGKCQRVVPEVDRDARDFKNMVISIIAKINADGDMDIQKLVASANGSPRRLYNEIMKLRMLKNNATA
jgi:DNA transposition AAA+ family ATPase